MVQVRLKMLSHSEVLLCSMWYCGIFEMLAIYIIARSLGEFFPLSFFDNFLRGQ